MTDDFEFEDPTGRYIGQQEFRQLSKIVEASISGLDFNIKGEYHGPHEVIMDWTMTFTMKPLWFPINLPMRTHILLEPAEGAGKQEKIFRFVLM